MSVMATINMSPRYSHFPAMLACTPDSLAAASCSFSITTDQHMAAKTGDITKRDIPVPPGFPIFPLGLIERLKTAPPGECCFPGQTPVPNDTPPESNGCGPKNGIKVPDLTFKECCNAHDICFGTCDKQFSPCNSVFRTCMVETCDQFTDGLEFETCVNAATIYYLAVQLGGASSFRDATKDSYTCECADKTKFSCGAVCVDRKNDSEHCGECYNHASISQTLQRALNANVRDKLTVSDRSMQKWCLWL